MVAPAVASSASADAEAARLEMARALVAALETQERERGLVLVPTASDLARAAHEKLQYDFPVVSPDELDALAEAMRADPRAFPITTPLVAAAVEGACAPSRSDAASTATSVAAAARARDDRDDDDANAGEARDARRRAFRRLCATVLVHVPLRAIRSSDADAAFARYHPRLEASHAPTSDDDAAADYADEGEPPKDADADGILDADSDSDWEPLEQGASRGASHQEPTTRSGEDHPALASLDPGARVDVKLVDVLRRAKSACFPDDADAAAAAASDASFIDLLEALAASDRPNRRALREVPVALLRDRWARAGLPPGPSAANANANASTLPRRFFAALGFGSAPAPPLASSSRSADPSAFGGEEDQDLALGALAHICARHGGAALGDAPGGRVDVDGGGAKRRDPRDAATRDVWRVVDAALAPVAARLERLVAEHRSRRESNDRGEKQTIITATDDDALDKWWLAVERCSIAAAFYAALAPGNADVGAALAGGGALRALASLFASPGVAPSPRAEALRRAVALVAASAPDAAAFLGAVPGVRAAVFAPDASPRFRAGGALAAHAAILAMAMRPTATTATKRKGSVDDEEEDAEAACAKLLAPMLVGEEASNGGGEGGADEGSEVSGAGAPGGAFPSRPRLARGSAASGLAAASASGLLRGAQIAASRARAAPLWRAGGPVDATLRAAAAAHAETVAAGARARGRTAAARADAAERKATASDDEEEEEEAMYIRGDARSGSVISGSSAVVGADVAAVVAAAKEADAGGGGAEAAAREAAGLGGDVRGEGAGGARGAAEAEAEKAREAAAAALRAIKEIVGAAEGGGGTRKCD